MFINGITQNECIITHHECPTTHSRQGWGGLLTVITEMKQQDKTVKRRMGQMALWEKKERNGGGVSKCSFSFMEAEKIPPVRFYFCTTCVHDLIYSYKLWRRAYQT